MLAAVVGGVAAFLSLFTHPSHIAYLLKNKGDDEIYRGVSIASLFLISISSVNWVIYGFVYAGVFTAIVATSNIIVKSLLLYLLWSQKRVGTKTVMLFIAAMLATVVVSFAVSQNVLGFLGTASSIVMWIPAAAKVVKAFGTREAMSYPPATSWLVIAVNTLWMVYGIALHDFWLFISSPTSVISGILMLVAYHSYKGSKVVSEKDPEGSTPQSPDLIAAK